MVSRFNEGIAAARRDSVIEACAVWMGNDEQDSVLHMTVILQEQGGRHHVQEAYFRRRHSSRL